MRYTEDGYWVDNWDEVFEVMYQWINPEVSLAYPQIRSASRVPEHVKAWKFQIHCQIQCDEINQRNEPQPTTVNPVLYDSEK